jgi:nucleoside-diphosphate-sugar epimerase
MAAPTEPLGARVLVTGGTGAIGIPLVRTLLDAGCQVRVLARRPPPHGLPVGAVHVAADATDLAAVSRAADGTEVIFHLAARLHRPQDAPGRYRVNVEGTATAARAARTAGVRRLVFFSSIAVYGSSRPPAVLDEQSPLRPSTPYARSKADAEAALEAICAPSGYSILRLVAVYGPNMRGNYARLLRLARAGLIPVPGRGDIRRALVHECDAARAALLAAVHPAAAGRTFNVSDGAVHTLEAILEAVELALERKARRVSVPAGLVRLIAATARIPGTPGAGLGAALEAASTDLAVCSRLITETLGFHARYDLVSGWADTVRRRRERGFAGLALRRPGQGTHP